MKRVAGLFLLLSACGAPQRGDYANRVEQGLQQCPSATVTGVDVSSGNGTIDWAQVHGAGVDFAFMKATQGDTYTSSTFAANWANSKANGVIRGAYHFFDPNVDGVAQANYFLSVVGALQPDDLPPVLDAECPDGDPNCLGYANSTYPSPDVIHQRILDFMTTVEAKTGRKPILYTFSSYFTGANPGPIPYADLAVYPLWIADTGGGSCTVVPPDWTSAAFWQFNWYATVAGISGQVDEDYFMGDLASLKAFAAGAPPKLHRYDVPDLDGDGRSDLCARGPSGIECWLATDGGFGARFDGPALADDAGWSDPAYYQTIQFADVTGDGRADLCARGASGMSCWPSTGAGFGAPITGPAWSDAANWNQPQYGSTIQLADIDGDGKADLCARSATGLACYLAAGGFTTQVNGPAMSDANDWGSPQYYATIQFADLDGDGRADVCARAKAGIVCWRSLGTSFDSTMISGPAWSDANGWDSAVHYPSIAFADVNGDGKADVCGRGPSGVECWLSDGSGFPTRFSGPAWSDASGWDALSQASTVQFADVNGDGKADVCGRSPTGMECWLSDGTRFATQVAGPGLSDPGGWNGLSYFWTLELGDVDGDGKADVCGRGYAGYFCWPSTGTGFGAQQQLSGLGDTDGFGVLPYYPTVMLVGGKPAPVVNPTTGSTSSGSTGTSATSGSGTTSSGGTSGAGASTGTSSGTTGGATATGGSTGGTGRGVPRGGCGAIDGGLEALFALGLLFVRRRRAA